MDSAQFDSLTSQGYTCIPLVREVLADLDTPLSAYLKLAHQPFTYLFESVQGGERWGRYSFIGLSCAERIKVYGNKVVHEKNSHVHEEDVQDPLTWVQNFLQQFNVPDIPELPRFTGGLVGYFGYETIQYIEPRLKGEAKPDVLQTPDIFLMVSKELVVFDSLSGKIFLIVHVDPKDDCALELGEQRLAEFAAMLQQPAPNVTAENKQAPVEFVSEFSENKFKQAVDETREYIRAGDVMQVVLSQRQSTEFTAPPINLYRSLRSLNPSPYMYYMNMEDFYIVGSSPEILVRLEDDEVTVRPMAGTRPRGKDSQHDIALEKELLQDPKELAEHLRLIDLGRNDVGRVAKTGTVELTDKMIIERYSHVMHIVSNVTGQLANKLYAIDVLRATFPAGKVALSTSIAYNLLANWPVTLETICITCE